MAERYIELFEKITGDNFKKENVDDVCKRVENNILNYLEKLFEINNSLLLFLFILFH